MCLRWRRCLSGVNSTRPHLEKAARDLGVQLSLFEAQDPEQIARALDAMAAAMVNAVNVLASPILTSGRAAIRAPI